LAALSDFICFQVKKGVKRKADTTTPTANSFDPLFTPTESKSAKISTRRESGRQIKKVVTLNVLMLWGSLDSRVDTDDYCLYDYVVGWYDPIAASAADGGRSPVPPGSTAPHVLQLEQPGTLPQPVIYVNKNRSTFCFFVV
jgi:hypothetical protein